MSHVETNWIIFMDRKCKCIRNHTKNAISLRHRHLNKNEDWPYFYWKEFFKRDTIWMLTKRHEDWEREKKNKFKPNYNIRINMKKRSDCVFLNCFSGMIFIRNKFCLCCCWEHLHFVCRQFLAVLFHLHGHKVYIMIIYSKSHSILIDLLRASVFLARLLLIQPRSLSLSFHLSLFFHWKKEAVDTHSLQLPFNDSLFFASFNFFSSFH